VNVVEVRFGGETAYRENILTRLRGYHNGGYPPLYHTPSKIKQSFITRKVLIFWLCWIPFAMIWKQRAGTMKEGTVPVPPYRPCAERWWRSTCSGVIASGEPQWRGKNPLERFARNGAYIRADFFKNADYTEFLSCDRSLAIRPHYTDRGISVDG